MFEAIRDKYNFPPYFPFLNGGARVISYFLNESVIDCARKFPASAGGRCLFGYSRLSVERLICQNFHRKVDGGVHLCFL